jgi:lipid A disaccharide synthetase
MSEKKSKRILVSAGDPSGDLILARVVSEWKKLHPEMEFVGLCGPESEKAGVRVLAN